MHRHFVAAPRLRSPRLTLTRDEARHLLDVLRVRVGDEIELFDGEGVTVRTRVSAVDRHGLALEQTAPPVPVPPPAVRLTLCVGLGKGKRMDWIVEKAVELGAARIVAAVSRRSVVRLDDAAAAEARRARWRRVALEAARQCGAGRLPQLVGPLPFSEAVAALAACRPLFVAALAADARPLREALARRRACPPPLEAGWAVGPEGDFTPEELAALAAQGGEMVSLGRQVLRTETAAVYGLAVLGAEWL